MLRSEVNFLKSLEKIRKLLGQGACAVPARPLAQGLLTNRYLNGIPEDSRVRTDGRFLRQEILTAEKLAQINA